MKDLSSAPAGAPMATHTIPGIASPANFRRASGAKTGDERQLFNLDSINCALRLAELYDPIEFPSEAELLRKEPDSEQ